MTFIKTVDKEVSDIGITEKFVILKNINVYQILAIKIWKYDFSLITKKKDIFTYFINY